MVTIECHFIPYFTKYRKLLNQKSSRAAAVASSEFNIMNETTSDLKNESIATPLMTPAIKRKLELIEKSADQISGLRSEIEYHSFDVV